MRAAAFPPRSRNQNAPRRVQPQIQTRSRPKPAKSCPFCLRAGRPSSQFLSSCPYPPESDSKFMAKARQVAKIFDSDEILADDVDSQNSQVDPGTQSSSDCGGTLYHTPCPGASVLVLFFFFYNHHAVRITVDSGATRNMMRPSTAHAL